MEKDSLLRNNQRYQKISETNVCITEAFLSYFVCFFVEQSLGGVCRTVNVATDNVANSQQSFRNKIAGFSANKKIGPQKCPVCGYVIE